MSKMPMSPSDGRYGSPAIVFHWSLAVLIATLVGLGWYMLSIEKQPGSAWFFGLHESLGITAAVVILLRLGWRIGHAPAALPDSIPGWQTRVAGLTHALLYVLMLLMPVTGYLGASFSADGVGFFGLPTPAWAVKNDALKEQLFTAHSIIAWILVGFVGVHVLGALKHLLIDKDGVFQRMLP